MPTIINTACICVLLMHVLIVFEIEFMYVRCCYWSVVCSVHLHDQLVLLDFSSPPIPMKLIKTFCANLIIIHENIDNAENLYALGTWFDAVDLACVLSRNLE